MTAYQIQNTKSGIDEYAGSIADPSSIDALRTTRLFTAWFEQSFGDVASLRIGQLAADDEFFTSNTAGGLINGTFGWASNLGANMLHGGPAYPFAAPGVRLKVDPAEGLSFLGAVFTGDPAGANCGKIDGDDIDPQTCNRHGFDAFALDGGSLWLGEVQYAVNQGKHAVGLPGVYKLGAWYETADFADQHFGLGAKGNVLTLADGSVTGPLNHGGDWGVYCVAIRWSGAARRAVSICSCAAAFRRPTAISLSYYIDGGAGIKGLLPRPP